MAGSTWVNRWMGRNYVGVTVLTQRVGEGDETAVNDGGLGGLLQVTAVDLRNTLQRDRESFFLSPGLPTTNQYEKRAQENEF